MAINLLHQAGHNSNWNRESFTKDNVGDGIIYSPVHDDFNRINSFNKKLKATSIFDPQFYLPNSAKPKFKTYDFFPNTIMNEHLGSGFSTVDYSIVALESARRCVKFQLEQGFGKLIIPTRAFEQFDPNYIESQSESFVNPFLTAMKENNAIGKKEIFLTVPITSHMLNIDGYKNNILNWITSYPEIDGIYLICQHDRKTKQIIDTSFLVDYMKIIKSTCDTGLKVIVGYTNTESLLYSLCGEISLTVGAFENTRIFSLDKFVVSDEGKRGPKPRIYIPKLMNWILFEEAKLIKKNDENLWNDIYTETKYSKDAFSKTKDPAFNTPTLYKHYFITFSEQITSLSKLTIDQRNLTINSWLDNANNYYSRINDILILDNHSSEKHVLPWKNSIKLFNK
ncbi:hypothetical protein ACPF44_002961 [Vibrio cholerae]|nr:hypothetical protein [Vibrio cholerae]EKF9890281.1 hypothetical protein [Vibrio cholerae]